MRVVIGKGGTLSAPKNDQVWGKENKVPMHPVEEGELCE